MKIKIGIESVTPLLMNKFNIDETQSKVKDKNLTPREVATKVCYLNEKGNLYYPSNNIYACIIEAGKFHKDGKVKITTARSSLIPAAVFMPEHNLEFIDNKNDWEVDSRPVVNPSTGGRMVCHRPRIEKWALEFILELDTKMFSEKTLISIITDAGSKVGLGDFRPSRKGVFGKFNISKWENQK